MMVRLPLIHRGLNVRTGSWYATVSLRGENGPLLQGLIWQCRLSIRCSWQSDVVAEAQACKVAGQHQRQRRQSTAGSQRRQLLTLGGLLGEAVSGRLKTP